MHHDEPELENKDTLEAPVDESDIPFTIPLPPKASSQIDEKEIIKYRNLPFYLTILFLLLVQIWFVALMFMSNAYGVGFYHNNNWFLLQSFAFCLPGTIIGLLTIIALIINLRSTDDSRYLLCLYGIVLVLIIVFVFAISFTIYV